MTDSIYKNCSIEKALSWMKCRMIKYKYSFIASLVTGFLTYMFAFTNKLVNHDDVLALFTKGSGLSSGRWALDYMHYIFPDYSMPWIYGVISVVLVAFASCMIIAAFDIKNKLLQALLSASIMAFPSLVGTFSYMFTVSSYVSALLLAVISFYLSTKNKWIYSIISVVALVVSLGIYQSYISVTASLMLLFLLNKLLYTNDSFLKVLKKGLLFLAILIASLGIYYLILQSLLHFTGTEMNSYANAGANSDHSILEKLYFAYRGFFEYVVDRKFNLITTVFSRNLHILMFLTSAVLAFLGWLKLNVSKKILSLVIAVLLPLSINCMPLVSSLDSIHTLVLYSFATVYVLFVMLLDHIDFQKIQARSKRIGFAFAKEIITWSMVLVVVTNVYIGNAVYLRMHLCYENMYGYYSSVMTLAKATPEFDSASKIALVGLAGNTLHFHTDFDAASTDITGTHGINVNSYTREDFIRNYIGTEIPFANAYEIEEIKKTPEFSEMPIYPYYGSIKKINDYVVVKFE